MSNDLFNVDDYRALAQRKLPRMIFDYLEGGRMMRRVLSTIVRCLTAGAFFPTAYKMLASVIFRLAFGTRHGPHLLPLRRPG